MKHFREKENFIRQMKNRLWLLVREIQGGLRFEGILVFGIPNISVFYFVRPMLLEVMS
jgi:hypothetical protein